MTRSFCIHAALIIAVIGSALGAVRPPRNVTTFETAADLVGTDFRSIASDGKATVVLRGWDTAGDGRGGIFSLASTNTTDATNTLDTLAASADGQVVGRWQRVSGGNRTVATVLDLERLIPAYDGETYWVQGHAARADWGSPKAWVYDASSTESTGRVVRATATGIGRIKAVIDSPLDVRIFGALPYPITDTAVPWGKIATNNAIGTSAFSVWIRTVMPTTYSQAYGMFELSRISSPAVTAASTELCSAFGMRASPDVWGFVFRDTTGGSGVGSDANGAAILESSPAALAAYSGQTVDIVFTRNGTNVGLWFNGSNVLSLFTNLNPAGWSKSLVLGEQVLTQIGNNGNVWFWPNPIQRFALWTSALPSDQAANPQGASGKVYDYTPATTNAPPDASAAVAEAARYLAARGGGRIQLPSGGLRWDTEVPIGKAIAWRGMGTSTYPSTFRRGFTPGATVLVPWFGATNRMFVGDPSQSGDMFLATRPLATLGFGNVSSRYLRSSISEMTFFGALARSSDGIWLDRVGSMTIRDIGCYYVPNHPVWAVALNSLQLSGVEGPAGRGISILGAADATVSQNFLDGPKGPALRFSANLCRIIGNVFEYALNPRTSVPPYEWPGTADTSADTITISSGYGHRLRTGHVVRFVQDSGTLPAPLLTDTDYYVVPTSSTSFRVYTNYVDEVNLTGAVYGSGHVDLTTSGSGTWYVGAGPSAGMLVVGDNNAIIGNQGQQNYDGGLILESSASRANSIVGNVWIMNGPGNPSTNVAAIRLKSSTANTIANNQAGDRGLSGYSQVGIAVDAESDGNFFSGNLVDVDRPYDGPELANQVMLDHDGIMGSWTGTKGNLYVPSRAGFSAWDPRDLLDSSAVVYDRSAKRLYLSSGITSDSTNWHYAVAFPLAGPAYWSASSGTLSVVNNGAGQTLQSSIGSYSDALHTVRVFSTNAAQGARFVFQRQWGSTSSEHAALGASNQIAEILFQGAASTNDNDFRIVASIEAVTSDALSIGDTPGALRLNTVPKGSSARQIGMVIRDPLSPVTGDSVLELRFYTNGVLSKVKPVKAGANNSGGAGFQALITPND